MYCGIIIGPRFLAKIVCVGQRRGVGEEKYWREEELERKNTGGRRSWRGKIREGRGVGEEKYRREEDLDRRNTGGKRRNMRRKRSWREEI